MSTAAYPEDKAFLQSYLEKLNADDDDDEEEDSELIRTIKADLDTEDDAVAVQENTSNIVIDDRYSETTEEVVNVEETIKPSSKSPMRKIAGTIVTTVANKRKRAVQAAPDFSKKIKTTTNTRKTVIKQEPNVKTIAPNETISSEVDNQEEIYEFDENEQDPDNPPDISSAEYVSKGVIKNRNKSSATATSDETTYSCMICPYEAKKKFLLSRHLKTHSEERPYKCSVCERGFKTSTSLMNHQNVHLGIKPHACKDCDMAFTTSGELVRHVKYRHTHIKPHKCTECDYSSVEMSKLRRHMRCHTGERPYQCPHCTYASPDTFKLKRHMRIHTGEKPYECDICHARFTQSNSLKLHRLIHSVNEKPVFQCHLCPTTCGRKTDLRLHIKTLHSSDKPIPCKRCGKELPDRYSYKMHIKTHEGEKCYRCEFCPYASISQRHLESHTFIHLDTKPFVCEICQTSFRQKALLARHMKVYHSDNYAPPEPRKKDHKCPHCNKTFAFNGNLIRHMEIHDPTSRVFEEKQLLKLGRMKRVQPDGTVVAPQMEISNELEQINNDENEEYYFELNEGEQQQQQQQLQEQEQDQQVEDDEEIHEIQYEDDEADGEEYNSNNIQYVYDELADDGYEGEENPQDGEEFVIQEVVDSEQNVQIQNVIDIKAEKTSTIQNLNIKTISNNDNLELMTLAENDEQDFMVIEVLPDDDEEDHEQINQELVQSFPTPSTAQNKPAILNKKAYKAKPKKAKTTTTQQPLISDYFGFEVDAEEDEQDEDTKGAIKLLEMIDQE